MFLGSVLQMPRVLLSKKIFGSSCTILLESTNFLFLFLRGRNVLRLLDVTFRVMGKGDKPNTKLE